VLVRIPHNEDARFTAGCYAIIPSRLEESAANLVYRGEGFQVTNGDFLWCDADDRAIPLVQGVYIVDPVSGNDMPFEDEMGKMSIPRARYATKG
jgi:hypothetical protein